MIGTGATLSATSVCHRHVFRLASCQPYVYCYITNECIVCDLNFFLSSYLFKKIVLAEFGVVLHFVLKIFICISNFHKHKIVYYECPYFKCVNINIKLHKDEGNG
jgi:hypothetical protein